MRTIAELNERVRRLLSDYYGPLSVDAGGVTAIPALDVTVTVEQGEAAVWILLRKIVGTEVEPTAELYQYVATTDHRYATLRLTENPNGSCTITAGYALLAETSDPEELRNAVDMLAVTVQRIGDDLRRRFGLQPTAGSATPAPSPTPVRPASFEGSIAVPLLPGWYGKESFTVLAPDGQANVIVSSEPLDPSIDVLRYAEVQGGLLAKDFNEYHETQSGDATLPGGIPCRFRQFGWQPPNGVRVTQLQIYAVPVPSRGYTATATSSESRWQGYAEQLRTIVFQTVIRPPVA